MADKFPELDIEGGEHELDGDFFSREKELVGDEFQTDQDKQVLAESDDEIQEFKEQFPEVDEAVAESVQPAAAADDDDDEFEGFDEAPPATKDLSESEPVRAWKERRDLEIGEREKANAKKKADVVSAAQQSIDDFYDNYNNKREQHAKEILAEEEAYLKKRDGFLKNGTLWDRVNELVTEVGQLPEDDRDKTRFKQLLTKLKGKENVPSAGGYTS